MSQIPKKGGIPSRLVAASATITRKQPGQNITHTSQINRIAQVQSCCGGGGGAEGPSTSLPQSTQLPQSRLQQPPPCCVKPKTGQPCPPKGSQTGMRQPSQTGIQQPRQTSLQPPRQTGMRQPSPTGIQPPRQTGMRQPSQTGIQQPRQTGMQPPRQTGMRQPSQTGIQPPRQTGMQPPRQTGMRQPSQTGIQPPRQTGIQPPRQTGMQPPRQTGMRQPSQTGIQQPSQTRIEQSRQISMQQQRQTGLQQPRTLAQPGFGRPPAQQQQLRPPQPSDRTFNVPASRQTNLPTVKVPSREPSPQATLPRPALRQPSKIETKIKSGLRNKSLAQPHKKVTAKAKQLAQTPPETIETPRGIEPVLQKAVFEKRVERDERGEAVIKNVQISKLNDQNEMDLVEMGIQQLDPNFATMNAKEIVGVTSTISISPSYATVSKDYVRVFTEDKGDIGISSEEVAKLIEEEKEDVDNTLKMIPPELMLSPGKYEMKQRLQQLRLNSESVALLEQSIIQPEITPDEAQTEPTPEAMATVMHTVETGITPDATPDQVFNSLFKEPPNEHFINLSSVTPGPLQDVVVPTDIPKEVHKEAVTDEMSKLTEKLNTIQPGDIPYVDIFTRLMSEEQKTPEKGKNLPRAFQPITDEKSLWVNANLEHLVNVVGAEPADILDPFNLDELANSENLETELANGVEYFLEANPVQYMNRVQLRGTQLPTYFPGYMVAVPDFPDLIKIVKSPDEVFAIAWNSVRPKYFGDDSMMSVM